MPVDINWILRDHTIQLSNTLIRGKIQLHQIKPFPLGDFIFLYQLRLTGKCPKGYPEKKQTQFFKHTVRLRATLQKVFKNIKKAGLESG